VFVLGLLIFVFTCEVSVDRASSAPHGRPAAAAVVAEALKKKSDGKVEIQRLKQQRKQRLAQLEEGIVDRERELRRSFSVLSGRVRVADDEQLRLLLSQLQQLKLGDIKVLP
jgi:hypothetical protein